VTPSTSGIPNTDVPVTVIAGYLGAGKTTLINRLLASGVRDVGVLVNDFGPLAIDAELIENAEGATIELAAGCVCCQIGDDLGAALEALRTREVRSVLIEASGVALPDRVAAYGASWPGYRPGGVFTVVDARCIGALLADKYVARLARDQITQADLVLISGTDGSGDVPDAIARFDKPTCDLGAVGDLRWLLEPDAATRAPIDGHPVHCAFATATWKCDAPLERSEVEAVIRGEPSIRRAKGWFVDGSGQRWLLQAAASGHRFEPAPGSGPVGLVFIHDADSEIPDGPPHTGRVRARIG